MFVAPNASYIKAKKIREYYLIFLLLFIAGVISAGRLLGIGADYNGYRELFTHEGFKRDSIEPAYRFLRYLNDYLFDGHVAPIYFISVITALSLKIRAFRSLSSHWNVVLFLYFLSFFFVHEYTQIRAAVAIGIFLCSIKDINENRSFCFFIKMLIATLFHYSAMIMLFCWIYTRMARSIKFCVVVTLTGVVFSIFFVEFASNLTKYVYLLQDLIGLNKSGGESDFMSPWNLKYATLLFLFLLVSTLIKKEDSLNFTLYMIFSFGVCCYYYLLPLQLPVISVGFAEFYSVVYVILMVNMAYNKDYCTVKRGYLLLFISFGVTVLYGYAAMKTITII